MKQTASPERSPSIGHTRWPLAPLLWVVLPLCLAGVLCVGAPSSAAPVASADGGPRIHDARIGFDGHFKVGHWTPLWIAAEGDLAGRDLQIQATTVDSDGVETTVSSPVPAAGAAVEGPQPVLLYVQVGRLGAGVDVTLLENGRVVDHFSLRPQTGSGAAPPYEALPATGELIAQYGSRDIGLAEALLSRSSARAADRRVVRFEDVNALPLNWYGYEGVNLLVLSADDTALGRALGDDTRRLAALVKWVELGGRLVLFSGQAGAELLAEGGPLAEFAPGELLDVVRLPQTSSLEHFAASTVPLSSGAVRAEVLVPRFENVSGTIELYAGRRPADLPLVVRWPRGMGEIAFAGFDFSAEPLAEWPGRAGFIQALVRPYTAAAAGGETRQQLVTLGYDDLSGALRQQLGRSFHFVTTISFSAVALWMIIYLVLLGPLDYWLVHRVLRRPTWAWVTFPLLVALASGGAYWAGRAAKGRSTRVNQLELVDIDTTTGQARGTYWGALYSPRAERLDLALAARTPSGTEADETLFSWWGLPGVGVGGMRAGGAADLSLRGAGYHYAGGLDSLEGVPLLSGGTKSLTARWTAPAETLVEANLRDEDGLVVGSLANRSGRAWRNARLLYGHWAYRLGQVADGQQIVVGQHLSPIGVKTLVTRNTRQTPLAGAGDSERDVFLPDRATREQLLELMMFYEVAGGRSFSQLSHEYQSFCDLSRLVTLGRAVLVVDSDGPGSELVEQPSGEPLRGSKDYGAVVTRFVLPVAPPGALGAGAGDSRSTDIGDSNSTNQQGG